MQTNPFVEQNKNINFNLINFNGPRVRGISPVGNGIGQDAQLSQRDRAAACIIVFAKSRRLELGDNILLTL